MYVPWRRDLKDCSWDTHIAKEIGKRKAYVGKMDTVLTDSNLATRIARCIMTNAIVPKLEYAGQVWEGNAKVVKQLENSTDGQQLKKYYS